MSQLSLPDRETLSLAIQRARRFADIQSSQSALAYLNHVVIDSRPEPKLYRELAEPWQWTLMSRLIPAIESIAGVRKTPYTGPRSFWYTLPRGHDKTSAIGRLASWALAYAKQPLRAIAAAADREQASFLWEFMDAESKLNPWILERLEFRNYRVIGRDNGARLKILTADANSSYGLREDLMILDEITHWPKEDLWKAIFTGREKVPDSVLIIISNAGHLNTWQHKVLQAAKKSPNWYVYEAPHSLAGWMNRQKIEENRKLLPAGLAKRLFDNVWVDPTVESGFVTKEEAAACIDNSLRRLEKGTRKHRYFASIDYAPVRDRTAMCVGHYDEETHRVILDQMHVLMGKDFPGGRVLIEVIERWLDEISANFFRPLLVIDEYQMESVVQKYQGTLDIVRFQARGGRANYELAANLRSLIVNKQIAFYPNAGEIIVDGSFHSLVDELGECLVKTMSYGWRLDHEANLHDDRVIAVGQMALQIMQTEGTFTIPNDSRWF